MRIEQYSADVLLDLLRKRRIATVNELKDELGTSSDATVHRKLRVLGYHTSYSHRGSYYTLRGTPTFDEWGLWSYRSVWFSKRGTLVATAQELVEEGEAGYVDAELERLLHVEVKGALLRLVREGRLGREKVAGRYLYTSAESARSREQVRARRVLEAESGPGGAIPHVDVLPDELKACIVLFFSLLDEKQRRLYAGLEALKVGHGGDQAMARLLDLDPGTVARGRRELLAGDVDAQRVRRTGGGRKPLEKKRRK